MTIIDSKHRFVATNKGEILIKKYSFGWAVVRGKYETIGSFRKIADLISAINAA